MKCIALLRAVNLPRHGKVAMADLRAMAGDLGLDDPQTLLQSGNLVFGSKTSPAKLEALLETQAQKRLGLKTEFIVRTAKQWDAVIENNPLPKEANADPSHLVVMSCKDAVPKDARITGARTEVVKPRGKELYIWYPDGIGRSRLKIAGVVGTGRNWNTVLKLGALARG